MKLTDSIRRLHCITTLLTFFAAIPLAVAQNAGPGASATIAAKTPCLRSGLDPPQPARQRQ